MFKIHHRRHFTTPDDYAEIVGSPKNLQEAIGVSSLEAARRLRFVSGDLVVDAATHQIVTDDRWLFDWEKADPDSYAQRAIRWQLRQP